MAGSAAAKTATAPSVVTADVQLLWVGSVGGMEQAIVERAGFSYTGISTGQLRIADPVPCARTWGGWPTACARASPWSMASARMCVL